MCLENDEVHMMKRGVTSGTMNCPVRRQMAGRVQYTIKGMDVKGYTTELI
jgi:hypothetical protein